MIADRVPVIAMAYANMVLARGAAEFAARAAEAGLAGVIVPDLPPEEAVDVRTAFNDRGLALIPLVAPTTPAARRQRICADAQGFVYLVSDTRTTGERDRLPTELAELIAATKADASVPVAVGFGIGTAEQAAEVGRVADGVIVGSRLVRAVAEGATAARQRSPLPTSSPGPARRWRRRPDPGLRRRDRARDQHPVDAGTPLHVIRCGRPGALIRSRRCD